MIVLAQNGAEALEFLLGTGAYAGRGTSDLPVVVLTSSNEDKGLARGYQLGANSYICKSVDFDQFADTVKTAWHILTVYEYTPAAFYPMATALIPTTSSKVVGIRAGTPATIRLQVPARRAGMLAQ